MWYHRLMASFPVGAGFGLLAVVTLFAIMAVKPRALFWWTLPYALLLVADLLIYRANGFLGAVGAMAGFGILLAALHFDAWRKH